MPTPDQDDALSIPPSPSYVKIPAEEAPIANEKQPAPEAHPQGDPIPASDAGPAQSMISSEDILNSLSLANASINSLTQRLAALEAALAAHVAQPGLDPVATAQ